MFTVGSLIVLDGKSFDMKGKWTDKTTKFGYDFWYQPRLDVMISTEWGSPSHIKNGLNVDDVLNGSEYCILSFTLPDSVSFKDITDPSCMFGNGPHTNIYKRSNWVSTVVCLWKYDFYIILTATTVMWRVDWDLAFITFIKIKFVT